MVRGKAAEPPQTTQEGKGKLHLECTLTDKEIIECSKTMAEAVRKRDEVLAQIETFKAQKKADATAAEAVIAKSAQLIQSGKEFRTTECTVVWNFATGRKTWTRDDTHEKVKEEEISADERQLLLHEAGAGGA